MKTKVYKVVFALAIGLFTANVQAQDYKIDLEKSKIKWHGEKVTGEHDGTIDLKKGEFSFKDGEFTSGSFVFDMTSMVNTDIPDKNLREKLEGHLRSEDFFGVEKYPEAKFVITGSKRWGGKFMVMGDLTIKGITHPIEFEVALKQKEDGYHVMGVATVDRSKYDIKYGSETFFGKLGDKAIYDYFELKFDLIAME